MAQKIIILSPDDHRYPKSRLTTWFNPQSALHALGNLDLLNLPLTALFCSRKCPGDAILKAYDLARDLREKQIPVIGGFHTPVERDMLEILLKGNGPIVICPARGLEGMRIPSNFQERLKEGKLLICSTAKAQEKRITAEIADDRNTLVAALADDWRFIYIDPDGKLEILSQRLLRAEL